MELEPSNTVTETTTKASTVLGLTSTTSYSHTKVCDEQRQSYWKDLLPYSGFWDTSPFFATMLRPMYMFASPIVLWTSFMFSSCISWLVMISFVLSQIFSAPPYNFTVSQVGATNMSAFVATIIGTVVAGPIIDGLAKYMSKKNKGIYEPEFRLPIMITFMVFTGVGFFAWGQSIANQDPWPVPVVLCLGMINLGCSLGSAGVTTAYLVDSHRMHAAEAFAGLNFIRNVFAFCLAFFANLWIESGPPVQRNAFFSIGAIVMAAALTTIPMYTSMANRRAASCGAST